MNTTETHVWPPELKKLIDEGIVRPPDIMAVFGTEPRRRYPVTRNIDAVIREDRGE